MRELAHMVALQSKCGQQPDEITAFLIARNWPQASARRFVRSVLNSTAAPDEYEYEYDEAPRHPVINWLRNLFLRDE